MHSCFFVFMHFCIFAFLHFCIFAFLHFCIFAFLHLCIFAFLHLCIYAFMYLCIYACMHTDRQTERDRQTDRQRQTDTYIHTHTHTYTYIHPRILSSMFCRGVVAPFCFFPEYSQKRATKIVLDYDDVLTHAALTVAVLTHYATGRTTGIMMDSSDISRPTDNGESPLGHRRHFVLANASFVPVVLILTWFVLVLAVFGTMQRKNQRTRTIEK